MKSLITVLILLCSINLYSNQKDFFPRSFKPFLEVSQVVSLRVASTQSCEDANEKLHNKIEEFRKDYAVSEISLGFCFTPEDFPIPTKKKNYSQSATVKYLVPSVKGNYQDPLKSRNN